jgi:sugar lactone lactonase YvrE
LEKTEMDELNDPRMNRREFLQMAGATAAGAMLAGSASAKEKTAPVRLGSGRWTYELVEGWGALPEGASYGYGCAVVCDSKDRIYVHSRNPQAVVVFDRKGRLLNTWGAEFAGTGHGLYHRKEGRDEFLFFCDHPRNLVVKTDLNGKSLMRIGDVKEENSTHIKFKFDQPTDLAVAPNGDIYVAEGYGGNRVHLFTAQGKYRKTIGAPGAGPGQFNTPHGIWVDTRKHEPELYVADRANRRIQVLTMDGAHKRFMTDDVRQPCCFYEHKGKMYIPDLEHRVTILDERDGLVAQLGDGKDGVTPATFDAPHAMCVDSHGDLYVIEWRADARVRKFRHTPQRA